MASETVMEQLRRAFSDDLYEEVREMWKAHSKAEDARDIPGLLATLTPDCVYELVQTGHRWEGHDGAARFYTELLTAFPDIVFELSDIVIGPQGVFEMADVHGTHLGPWLGVDATRRRVEFQVGIFFPWDGEQKLFSGERVWSHGLEQGIAEGTS